MILCMYHDVSKILTCCFLGYVCRDEAYNEYFIRINTLAILNIANAWKLPKRNPKDIRVVCRSRTLGFIQEHVQDLSVASGESAIVIC